MAGVPSIMQAMLDEVAPKLKASVRMLSETVRADLAGEAEWRTTRTTPLAQPTPQELLPCAANQRAWCSRITALALRSQPTRVVLADNGHRLCGVVHAARYLPYPGSSPARIRGATSLRSPIQPGPST